MGRMPSVLPVPVPATMPNPTPRARPLAQFGAVLPLEQRVHVGAEREFDRLAGGPGRRDDDDPPPRVRGRAVGGGIGGQVVVARGMHGGKKGGKRNGRKDAPRHPLGEDLSPRDAALPATCWDRGLRSGIRRWTGGRKSPGYVSYIYDNNAMKSARK